jgi:hypothetical protein
MKKIIIPETSLIVELESQSFWLLLESAEEKTIFETKDSVFYFNDSNTLFFAKKEVEDGEKAASTSCHLKSESKTWGSQVFTPSPARTAFPKPSTLNQKGAKNHE